jgi:hypothetical protein
MNPLVVDEEDAEKVVELGVADLHENHDAKYPMIYRLQLFPVRLILLLYQQ